MPWWTASADLTAIAAHDAAHAGGGPSSASDGRWIGLFSDLLGGTNTANCQGYVNPTHPNAGVTPAYYGMGSMNAKWGSFPVYMPYKTAVALPTNGAAVVLMYLDVNGFTGPLLAEAPTGTTYMLACNGNTLRMGDAFAGPALNTFPGFVNFRGWYSFGVHWDASNYQLVFEGTNYGSARAFTGAIRPASIAGLVTTSTAFGSGGTGAGVYQDDAMGAIGLFSGTGSAAAIASISAAMRAELLSPAPGIAKLFNEGGLLTRNTDSSRETGIPVGAPTAILYPDGKGFWRGAEFGGVASFAGIVTVENVPAIRRVFLFDKMTKTLLDSTWSNSTGQYGFYNLNPTQEYFIWAEDNARVWNAVTQDRLVPS